MATSRARYASGELTRTRLIESAERLFAERGYNAVSLNDIRQAADQHNASAISYHFGSKANLLQAVFEHRLPSINADRNEVVATLYRDATPPTTRAALWATVRPLANTLGGGNHYVGVLDQLLTAGLLTEHFMAIDASVNESGRVVVEALRTSVAHLPPEAAELRLELVFKSMLRHLADLGRKGLAPTTAELTAAIDAWEGLLLAPVSSPGV
ncbi:TetR family transcriptional regulator [Williamsia sp.]|uniref:TetR family transcriptional regulator n=1 Tax=Williamsia sp. TaxID=1872085 RepID=UPI002F92D6E1